MGLLVIDESNVAGIPALIVVDQEKINAPLPLVIFWHGWTSGKESYLRFAYLAAKEGFRVVIPDATGHGERLEELTEQEENLAFGRVSCKTSEKRK